MQPTRKFIELMNNETSAADARIVGKNIRTIRSEKKLTLKQLSRLSGVSIATISKIETSKISGGFETIYKIARGLGVLVTDILSPEEALAETVVVHSLDSDDVHRTGIYDYYPQAYRRKGLLNPYVMQVSTRTPPDKRDWSIHGGEEVIIVLYGSIELLIDGEEPIQLESGDSACFDCGNRHAFVCTSTEDAQIVSVSTRGPSTRNDGHLVFSDSAETS